MSDLREQIARQLAHISSGYVVEADAPDLAWQDWTVEADAILALLPAPRVVTTVAELEALPERTVLRLANGALAERKTWADGRPGLAISGSELGYMQGNWSSDFKYPNAPAWLEYLPATVLTPAPAPCVATAEQVEATLIREWHEDQCACRDFDGTDMATCYTRQTSKYGFVEPMTWTVEAVLRAASAKGDGK